MPLITDPDSLSQGAVTAVSDLLVQLENDPQAGFLPDTITPRATPLGPPRFGRSD